MSERIDTLKQGLISSREKLNQALDLIGDKADEQIYSDGAQWTLRQLAIHLMLADIGHNRMVYHYSQDKEFIPADYDINHYNQRSVDKRAEMTLEQARTSLEQSREEFMQWLDALEDESILDKTGRYPTLELFSIQKIVQAMAIHEDRHATDIMAMLSSV